MTNPSDQPDPAPTPDPAPDPDPAPPPKVVTAQIQWRYDGKLPSKRDDPPSTRPLQDQQVFVRAALDALQQDLSCDHGLIAFEAVQWLSNVLAGLIHVQSTVLSQLASAAGTSAHQIVQSLQTNPTKTKSGLIVPIGSRPTEE